MIVRDDDDDDDDNDYEKRMKEKGIHKDDDNSLKSNNQVSGWMLMKFLPVWIEDEIYEWKVTLGIAWFHIELLLVENFIFLTYYYHSYSEIISVSIHLPLLLHLFPYLYNHLIFTSINLSNLSLSLPLPLCLFIIFIFIVETKSLPYSENHHHGSFYMMKYFQYSS